MKLRTCVVCSDVVICLFGSFQDEAIENPDPHFEPLVHLAPVHTKTLEEDEDEMLKLYVVLI